MAKLADGKRLSDHLQAAFEGKNREAALSSVKDMKALAKSHPDLVEPLTEDASRRRMTPEQAREKIVVPWIEANLDGGKAKGGGKAKAASRTADTDEDEEDDTDTDTAAPAAGGAG